MADGDAIEPSILRRKLGKCEHHMELKKIILSKSAEEKDISAVSLSMLLDLKQQILDLKAEHDEKYDLLCEADSNATAIKKDATAAGSFHTMMMTTQDICEKLLSRKRIHGFTQTLDMAVAGLLEMFTADPGSDHSAVLTVIQTKSKQLEEEMFHAPLKDEHELMEQGRSALKRAFSAQSKVTKPKIEDTTASRSTGGTRPHYRVTPLSVPSFSGKT